MVGILTESAVNTLVTDVLVQNVDIVTEVELALPVAQRCLLPVLISLPGGPIRGIRGNMKVRGAKRGGRNARKPFEAY